MLWQYRQDHPRNVVGDHCPLYHQYTDYDNYDFVTETFRVVRNECIPSDLWENLVLKCGISSVSTWSKLSPKKVRALADLIVGCPLEFCGRNTEEGDAFINAGGISLIEVDLCTMQSVKTEGLYCCGQLIDGDASYGSFSLMRGLALARVAGENAAAYVLS